MKKHGKTIEIKEYSLQILRNGTCTLLYLKVPKHSIQGEAPQYQSESLDDTLWNYSKSHNLVNIKGLWKKLIKSEKFTKISRWHQQ